MKLAFIENLILSVFSTTAYAKTISTDPATSAVETTREVSQHFAEISHTDPLAAFCFVVGLISISLIIISFISPHFKSKVPSLSSMGGRFVLLLFGGFFLMLPIAMHMRTNDGLYLMWPYLYQSIPAAFFLMFNTLGFSANLVLWTPVIHIIMGYSVLANLYFWLIVFYIIASPVLLALTAADVIVNGITGISITVLSWKNALFKRPVYVFFGVDSNTLILANNLLQHLKKYKEKTRPLIIFSNVIDSSDPRIKMLVKEAKELSYGVASLISTPLSATAIPAYLAHLSHIRSTTTYFAVQENGEENVILTEALLDDTIAHLHKYESKRRKSKEVKKYSKMTLCYAEHTKLWCMNSDEHDFSLKYDEKKKRLFNLIEVNVIDSQRDAIWDCFSNHPLTSVLSPIDIAKDSIIPSQELTVIVADCDSAGLQAIRSASWFGILPGVKLTIVGSSENPKETFMQLSQEAPDTLSHTSIHLIDSALSRETLYSFVEGNAVSGFSFSNNTLVSQSLQLSKTANVYALLVNSSQEGSLSCALHVMRASEKRIIALKEKGSKKTQLPKTLIMLQTEKQAHDVIIEPKDKTESALLVQMKTFGAKKEQLSYEKIIDAKEVRAALSVRRKMNQQVRRDGLPVGVQAEPLSTQKNALLSTIYFIPSLLWCLDTHTFNRSQLKRFASRYKKLLIGSTKNVDDLLETITFKDTRLNASGAEARLKQLKAHEENLHKKVPVLVKVANVERERMSAYLRAQGWTTCSKDLQELLEVNHFFGIGGDGKIGFPNPNITQIKQDYLLVDDLQEYYERSASCGCDSPAYDRARVFYSLEAFLR